MEYITEARKKQIQRIRREKRRRRRIRRLALLLGGVLVIVAAGKGIWTLTHPVAADTVPEISEEVLTASESSGDVVPESSQVDKELSQSEKLSCILTDDAYPEQLKEMAQKNSEAIDFVYNYPRLKDEVWEIDLTEESQKEQVPLLIQWDERWGYTSYNGGILGYTGCGPTSLAMVILYLTKDTSIDPTVVAAYAESAGYCVPGSGSSWTLISEGSTHFGLQAEELAMMEGRIKAKLDEGCPIIVNVGPGDFTDSGHYMVIVGYDSQGFIINDPNSYVNSQKRWNFDQLNGQVRNLWAMSR